MTIKSAFISVNLRLNFISTLSVKFLPKKQENSPQRHKGHEEKLCALCGEFFDSGLSRLGYKFMAQTDSVKLDSGDSFPAMMIQMIDVEHPLRLPEDFSAEYTIFLGYRGKW